MVDNKIFTDFRARFGRNYSSLILEKDATLTARQVQYVFTGTCLDVAMVEKVIDAIEKVLGDTMRIEQKAKKAIEQLNS